MLRRLVKETLRKLGYEVRRAIPPDLPPEFVALYESCRPYTMTSIERMYGLHQAVRYVEACGIEGDLVECGVWRGGSGMNMALTLLALGSSVRDLYLYDTYAGMTTPTEKDVDAAGRPAMEEFQALDRGDHNEWCFADLRQVRRNLLSTGYPEHKLHFIFGRVEETIPDIIPDRIALLRLDTDWYESTYHELTHLYPRLVSRGVLIVDDYGHWKGAREATDVYFREHRLSPLLFRTDYTGRMMIKF